MKLFGVSYAVAQNAMIVLTSLLPWAVYLLGRELFGGRAVPLIGAALAAVFHLFMDQVCAPLSHGPYVLGCTLALWLILRSVRDPRLLFAAGGMIALVQLSRSDGIVLFAVLAAAHLCARRRPVWRHWALLPLGYALIMSPWWLHNLSEHGALQPGGSFRAVFLREYDAWYSLPESVTRETWLADGWEPVLALKRRVAELNLDTALNGLVVGAADRKGAWEHPALVAVLWLAWAGWLAALFRPGLRARFAPLWLLLALQYAFYSLVFTAVGPESFRSGMYSVYPAALLAAAFALDLLARGLAAGARRAGLPAGAGTGLRAVVLLGALGWIAQGQLAFAHASMISKSAGITNLNRFHEALGERVFKPLLEPDSVVMARDVHQLAAINQVRCVTIPHEPEPVIRQVARRYGVTHLLIIGDPARNPGRKGLRGLDRNPHWKRVAGPLWIEGQRVQVYVPVDP